MKAEALSLCEECLAATQFLLRTQVLGDFSLFPRRDVLEGHQSPALGMARERQGAGIKNHRPPTLDRTDVIHLNGLERMSAREHFVELVAQRGKVKGALPELAERDPLRLVARHPKHRVEGAIARLDPLVSAQHDEGIGERVEDRLGAFAFVDGLIDASAESSHICESQQRTGGLAITPWIGGYPNDEPPLPLAKIDSIIHSTGDDLATLLFQAGQSSEHRDIAGRPTNVGWREAEHVRGRFVEAGNPEVSLHQDDGNFHGIEDVDQIGRSRACSRVVTSQRLETGPAAVDPDVSRHHGAAPDAAYRVRLRCRTGSATVGTT